MKRASAIVGAFALLLNPAFAQIAPRPGGGGSGTPGGSNGQLQYNNSGAFGGATVGAGLSFSGGALSNTGVQSVSTTCPSSGPTTGAITLSPSAGRLYTGTADTLGASDCGGTVEYSNAAAISVALPAAASLGAGWCVNLAPDSGAGLVTVNSGGGNFNTTASTTLTISAPTAPTICTNAAANGFIVGSSGSTGNVTGPASSTSGDLPSFNGATGKTLQDSGVPAANVVQGPASSTDGNVATYNGATGKIIKDSGIASALVQQSYTVATGGNGFWFPLWYGFITAATGNGLTQNSARCAPFYRALAEHWDSVSIDVTTTGTSTLAFALYADGIDATTHRHQPQAPITSGSGSWTVSGAPAAVSSALGVAGTGIAIPQGLNWICVDDPSATDPLRTTAMPSTSSLITFLVGSSIANGINATSVNQVTSLTTPLTLGSWTSFAGVSMTESTTSIFPLVAAHIVSTP